jgi:putative flippase GtrA
VIAKLPPGLLLIARFGIVGLTAAVVHSGLFLLLVSKFGFSGLGATPIAFGFAFVVSYIGQSRWTFGAGHSNAQLVRYGITQLVGLGLNALAAHLIVDVAGLRPVFCLPFIVFAIPAVSFGLMRLWVFPQSRPSVAFSAPESHASKPTVDRITESFE